MSKFRPHTLEEKRKLRNSRQKRKRKAKAAKILAIKNKQQDSLEQEIHRHKVLVAELRRSAGDFYKKWESKCHETSKLIDSLAKIKLKVRAINCFQYKSCFISMHILHKYTC